MANCDIMPRRCRPVLVEMLHKGFIEDEEKFGEAFGIMMMVVTGNLVGDWNTISPEVYQAVLEGRELKRKRDEADVELQEFEEYISKWNLDALWKLKTRGRVPSKELHRIPEEDELQHREDEMCIKKFDDARKDFILKKARQLNDRLSGGER